MESCFLVYGHCFSSHAFEAFTSRKGGGGGEKSHNGREWEKRGEGEKERERKRQFLVCRNELPVMFVSWREEEEEEAAIMAFFADC